MTIDDIKPLDIEPIHDTVTARKALKAAIYSTNVASEDLYKHMALLGSVVTKSASAQELLGIAMYEMPDMLRYTGHLRNDARALAQFYREMTDIYARLQAAGIPFVCSKAFAEAKRKCAKGNQNGNDIQRAILKHSEEIFTYWMPYLVQAGRMHIDEFEELIRVADANGYADTLPVEPRKNPLEGVAFHSNEFNSLFVQKEKSLMDTLQVVNKALFFQDKRALEPVKSGDNMAAIFHNLAGRAQYALDHIDWMLYSRKMMMAIIITAKEGVHQAYLEAFEVLNKELEELRDLFLEMQDMVTDQYLNNPKHLQVDTFKKECANQSIEIDGYMTLIDEIFPPAPNCFIDKKLLEEIQADNLEGYLPLMNALTDSLQQLRDYLAQSIEDPMANPGFKEMKEEHREPALTLARKTLDRIKMEISIIDKNKTILAHHPLFYFLEAETFKDPHCPDFPNAPKKKTSSHTGAEA